LAADGPPSFVHVPDLGPAGSTLAIGGDEAHYLGRVVRVRAGEHVIATDGRGAVATLEVTAIGTSVQARVLDRREVPRPARLELWCGAPEGDRADWLVEKLAELGVAQLRPVDGARSRWERVAARRGRWERLSTAALRQSRSAWKLELAEPLPLAEAVSAAGETAGRWVGRPDGRPGPGVVSAPAGRAIGVIGPSSGFSEPELKALQDNGFVGVALAAHRLRTETAALALASLWAAADTGSGRAE